MTKVTLNVELELDLTAISLNTKFVYDGLPGVQIDGKALSEIIERELQKKQLMFRHDPNVCGYCGSPTCMALYGHSLCGEM